MFGKPACANKHAGPGVLSEADAKCYDDVAYSGAVDMSAFPALLQDLQPLPACMDPAHLPTYPNRDNSMLSMLWASNGDIDSGLHYDEYSGGFLMVVVGRKDILLFPPADSDKLYTFHDGMGRPLGYSRLFMGRDLQVANKGEFPDLWDTHPYTTTLMPGDILYTPHRWWHEVYTVGQSIAYSAWLQPPEQPPEDNTRLYDLQGNPL